MCRSGFRRLTLLAGLATLSALASLPASAQQCNFIAPPEWSSATSIRWFGACDRGSAQGLGVLRAYFKGAPGPAFYGRMTNGSPQAGVIESDSGFAAGTLVSGKMQPTDDRQKLIDAFRIGAAGARAASAKFKAENNAGSAQLYARKASQLENQMD